ncbi:MAG: hypothetical protein IJI87_09270 [Mogibacterium sp.]|nr:hypothetical protein [Mogibacterium sp.]
MAIKLDLGNQREKDKARPPQKKKTATAVKHTAASKDTIRRSQGRPKGSPAVTRSLRIRTDINELLVQEHQQTGLSFNELANRAFAEYLQK